MKNIDLRFMLMIYIYIAQAQALVVEVLIRRRDKVKWYKGLKPEAAMTQARLPTEFPIKIVGF